MSTMQLAQHGLLSPIMILPQRAHLRAVLRHKRDVQRLAGAIASAEPELGLPLAAETGTSEVDRPGMAASQAVTRLRAARFARGAAASVVSTSRSETYLCNTLAISVW